MKTAAKKLKKLQIVVQSHWLTFPRMALTYWNEEGEIANGQGKILVTTYIDKLAKDIDPLWLLQLLDRKSVV